MEDTFDLAGLHHGKPGRRHRAEPEARDRPGHRQAGEQLDACDLCLHAWPCYNASGCEASDRAIALLRRALEKDPTYMRAKALLASAYATREAQDFVSRGDREMRIALARSR